MITAALTAGVLLFCSAPDPDPPEYYAFPLVTTKRVPGTAFIEGIAEVTFRPSPFGVSISADGSFVYDVHLAVDGLEPQPQGVYVAWAMTTEIDRVKRLGPLENGRISGRVSWNKFLVAVTLEEGDDPDATMWSGPLVMRGMSRSGRMHTMAGHGPFQEENCAAYGFAN